MTDRPAPVRGMPAGRLALAAGVALAVVGLALPAVGQQPGAKADKGAAKAAEKPLMVGGQLTGADPFDPLRPGCHHKVHTYRMNAGTVYVLELDGMGLDTYLRLEDSAGKDLKQDDDGGGNGNARIVYRADKTDDYRLIATTYSAGAVGAYVLRATPLAPDDPAEPEAGLNVPGQLTPADPTDRERVGSYHKVHPFKMVAGKTYVIEMFRDASGAGMDPYLRLEDSAGTTVEQDDDSAGNLNARIVFTAAKSDTYRIIATTLGQAQTGNYLVRARALAPGEARPVRGAGIPVAEFAFPQEFGDIVITPVPRPPALSGGGSPADEGHGYLEYRFVIENRSETDGHRVALKMPRHAYGGPGYFLRSLRTEADVPPGRKVTASLFQPELRLQGAGDVEVTVDGKVQAQGVVVNLASNRGQRNSGTPFFRTNSSEDEAQDILTTADLAPHLEQHAEKSGVGVPPRNNASATRTGTYKGKPFFYADVHRFHASSLPLKSWSPHWLAYSRFDGVALAGPRLQAAPPEVQAALWRYVEAGGSLLVIGTGKLPESWERRKEEKDDLVWYYPGFGRCLVVKAWDVTAWEPEQWKPVVALWESAHRAWRDPVRTPSDANRELPVVDNQGIPVRGMFLTMLLFSVFIGPVNVYVLARKRRRLSLLWNVPLFSFATCAALFGYMLASEGWHGHVRTEGVTYLDEASGRATSVGWMGFYAPVSPGDGLHFGADTEVTPHFKGEQRSYYRGSTPLAIDWSDGQRLEGWLTPRVPLHLLTRTSLGDRPERLVVAKEAGGGLSVTNQLKARVKSLWLADEKGRLYTAEDIADGARAPLKRAGDDLEVWGEPGALHDAFARDWRKLGDVLEGDPARALAPGCYLAVVDGAPFFEEGLRNAQTRRGRSVVYGVLKEPF